MPLSSFIRVKTQFEGLHHWPDAPEPEPGSTDRIVTESVS